MAFDTGKLVTLADSNGVSIWSFESRDKLADVLSPGYFPNSPMEFNVRPGDILIITCWPEGTRFPNTNPTGQAVCSMWKTREGIWCPQPYGQTFPLADFFKPGRRYAA